MTNDHIGLRYQIYSFDSNEIKNQEDLLIHTINKGYNVPRFQFNIITTPRIKHSLIEDLCILPSNESFIIFCFVDEINNFNNREVINYNEDIDNAQITKEKLLKIYSNYQIDFSEFKIGYDHSILSSDLIDSSNNNNNLLDKIENLKLPSNFTNKFLGMICLKSFGEISQREYEITGFISFFPGVGSQLIKRTEEFAKVELKANKIWITAIEEHKLRKMYEKFGYKFIKKVLVPVSAEENGKVVENNDGPTHLENDIAATCDFHLEILSKTL